MQHKHRRLARLNCNINLLINHANKLVEWVFTSIGSSSINRQAYIRFFYFVSLHHDQQPMGNCNIFNLFHLLLLIMFLSEVGLDTTIFIIIFLQKENIENNNWNDTFMIKIIT